MSVLSDSAPQLPSLSLLPTLGGAAEEQTPWGWADHGEAEAGVEEGRPCLVGQRGDLSLTWREEEGGSYRRLWAEEGGAYRVLWQQLSGRHQGGRTLISIPL